MKIKGFCKMTSTHILLMGKQQCKLKYMHNIIYLASVSIIHTVMIGKNCCTSISSTIAT